MTTVNEKSDTETILSDGRVLHLPVADVDVKILDLGTRQFFKFLKIFTTGAGEVLSEFRISADTDPEEVAQTILALLVVAVPEAEDEAIEFIQSMVAPLGLVEPERSKADRDKNTELFKELYTKMQNPAIEDSLEILMDVVTHEAPNLIALGKRVAAMLTSTMKLSGSSKKPSKK